MRSTGSKRAVKTLFISKKMLPVAVDEPVNVVLAPSYYWFREAVLPAKTAQQAKKLAPSFFDGIIAEGEYEYMAVPHDERFWLFAYDPQMIADALLDAGLKRGQVRAIYFAQLECGLLDAPVRINEQEILVANDGVLGVLSMQYSNAAGSVEALCAQSPRSRHKVSVNLYRTGWLDEKQLARLTVVAVVFLGLYLGDYLINRHQYKQQLIYEQTLKERYRLPETSFQLDSLQRSLNAKASRQMRLRKVFKQLTQLPLQPEEGLLQLDLSEKKADVQIALVDPKRAEPLKAYLQQHARVASAKVKDNIFYVSLSL